VAQDTFLAVKTNDDDITLPDLPTIVESTIKKHKSGKILENYYQDNQTVSALN